VVVLTNLIEEVDIMGDFLTGVKIIPINGMVLVRIDKNSQLTSGGIIIPETAREVPIRGEVVATSFGIYENGTFRPHEVNIGDTIIFRWKTGYDIFVENEEYRLLPDKEILARIEGENYGEE
jgi:chaperonin GroES